MKASLIFKSLVFVSLIIVVTDGNSQVKVEIKTSNGLNSASFNTKEGKINVYFPEIREGDIISGTVLAEPEGKNDRQKEKNSNVISGYVVEVENDNNDKDRINIKDKVFQWVIPAALTEGLRLVLKNPSGQVIAAEDIEVLTDVPYIEAPSAISSENFSIPEYLQAGSPGSIPGFFDGDFSTTDLTIGGNEVSVIAESPRGIFFESPQDISGKTEIQLNEGDVAVEGQVTAYNLSLTADKLNLQRGDQTTVHVRVNGLEGLDREIPVDISNLTENTVTVEGGNQQSIMISPSDISQNGTFNVDIPVTAISSGGFSVAVNVKPPQPVVISKIYPVEFAESTNPNFIWSVINPPTDCTYSITIRDVKTFSNIADLESFEFNPDVVNRIEPLLAENMLTEPSFALSESDDIQLQPGHLYAWQVTVLSDIRPLIISPMWYFSVNGSDVSDNYVHITSGQYASKYYPRSWRHIRTGTYASKIYNPATHRHLTTREYNTKIYSTADYRHITRDKDKTKIYPANLRHIASGDNESYLYNPEEYQPHRTTGSRASILIPNGFNHLLNEADRTKIYPESDRHLITGDNNTKIVPSDYHHLTQSPFNTALYPRSSRHISWGTTNVSKIIPEGMVHLDSGDDLSKLYSEADRHLKGGRDNSKVVPAGNKHVSSGDNQSKIYPSGNNHIRTGTNASGIYNPDTEKHRDMGDDQTKIIPGEYYHISSGEVQSKYGPSGARHIDEGDNSTKLHTRDGRNIEPGNAENPDHTATEPGRPGESTPPDKEAVKPEREAGTPSAQPEEPGEPQEPKELDEW